jgi:hypothetical protein
LLAPEVRRQLEELGYVVDGEEEEPEGEEDG